MYANSFVVYDCSFKLLTYETGLSKHGDEKGGVHLSVTYRFRRTVWFNLSLNAVALPVGLVVMGVYIPASAQVCDEFSWL